MSSKITPEARHRRSRETLAEQLLRNKNEISQLLERNRKIEWAIRLHDDCHAEGVTIGDQGDIDFHLQNDDGRG